MAIKLYINAHYTDDEGIEYEEPADHTWLDENGDLCIGITVNYDDKQMLI